MSSAPVEHPPRVDLRTLQFRLDDTIEHLTAAYDEYATCWEAERLERASSILQAQGQMAQGAADSWVMAKTAPLACETVRAAQSIKALEATITYLYFRMAHL